MSDERAPSARPGPRALRVLPATESQREQAARLAERLGAVLVPTAPSAPDRGRTAESDDVAIWVGEEGVGLVGLPAGSRPRFPPPPPLRPRRGRELVLRALGGDARTLHVVDATAGWGEDAGIVAAAGARVTMVERSPAVAEMLEAALVRWRQLGHPAALRLRLVRGDAMEVLRSLADVDAVVLDPFFAGRSGRATTAAELRWLRRLVELEGEAASGAADAELLAAAQRCASRRVIVKRPRAAPPLAGVRPSGSLGGRVVRYDLYPAAGGEAPPT